jgi:hypothetical protein
MPNNFNELQTLLGQCTVEDRDGLREIIGLGWESSPKLLCDHLCFLRAGPVGQLVDRRDYKQLVTDIADEVSIDWNPLVTETQWKDLTAIQIEEAIVSHVELEEPTSVVSQPHVPEMARVILKEILVTRILRSFPLTAMCSTPIEDALDGAISSLNTDWRKLLAAVLYINRVIRPAAVNAD